MLSVGYVLLDKISRQLYQSGCCGPVYQNYAAIKESMNMLKSLYKWILRHPHVFQSPIDNYCLKLNIDGQEVPQLVTNLLLKVSVRELHNSMMIPPE